MEWAIGDFAESTNMNGTACCACWNNNVQFHLLFDELQGVKCHLHQLYTNDHVPTYVSSSLLSFQPWKSTLPFSSPPLLTNDSHA